MTISGVGIDLVLIKRFEGFDNKDDHFLKSNFSADELDYCFSFSDPFPHLAGTFAAKEAVIKSINVKRLPTEIEIRHVNGKPSIWIDGQPKPFMLSISHSGGLAVAIVLNVC